MSLDSSQHVIGENEEIQHRRQLGTVRAMVLADRGWIVVLMILPVGKLLGTPILGLANALLTAFFFVATARLMLRFVPAPKSTEVGPASH